MSLTSTRRPGRRRPSPRPTKAAYVPRHLADEELMGQTTKPITFDYQTQFDPFTAAPFPPSNPPEPEPEEEEEPAAEVGVRHGRIRSALTRIRRNLTKRSGR